MENIIHLYRYGIGCRIWNNKKRLLDALKSAVLFNFYKRYFCLKIILERLIVSKNEYIYDYTELPGRALQDFAWIPNALHPISTFELQKKKQQRMYLIIQTHSPERFHYNFSNWNTE